jgi:hypothetical protein
LRQVNVSIEVARKRSELFVGSDLIFGALAVAQNRLRGFLIVPEIRRGNAAFQGFQAFAMGSRVKDSSEPL